MAELNTKTYKHQAYSTFHVYDPKFRVINKAEVRDRVVHHLIYKYLEPIFQPSFIYHSYSCQEGKGIHMALKELFIGLRKASKNYTRQVWTLKLDIKKFFDSIDHEVLLALLFKKIVDPDIRNLLGEIVRSFSSPQGQGIGLPIGNLTSQIFANIYLSELDYFAKHNLKEKYYYRYADDFLFIDPDKAHLQKIEMEVADFVSNRLHLTVHPKKIVYRKFSEGIDFVGYVLLPHYSVLRTKTKRRMFKKVGKILDQLNEGATSEDLATSAIQSYLGLLKHCSANEIKQRIENEVWLRGGRRDGR